MPTAEHTKRVSVVSSAKKLNEKEIAEVVEDQKGPSEAKEEKEMCITSEDELMF